MKVRQTNVDLEQLMAKYSTASCASQVIQNAAMGLEKTLEIQNIVILRVHKVL